MNVRLIFPIIYQSAMDHAVFPQDVMKRIFKYSQDSPIALILTCKWFAQTVKQYTPWLFKVTNRVTAKTSDINDIGPLKNIIFVKCVGKHLRVLNPKSLYLRKSIVINSNTYTLNRLTTLDMSSHPLITNDALSRLTTLTSLNISTCPQITHSGIITLTQVRDLTMTHDINTSHMPLVNLRIRNPPHGHLTGTLTNTTLRCLQLSYCNARGYDNLPLCKLELINSGHNWVNLRAITTLTDLTISRDDLVIDDDIVGMTSLTSLSLDNCMKISDYSLSTFTALQYLRMSSNNMCIGTCLFHLKHLRDLTISLDDSEVDPREINHAISQITALTSLNISFPQINDTAVSTLTDLTALEMRDGSQVTNTGLRALTNLTFLSISDNPHITNRGIEHLILLSGIVSHKSSLTQKCAEYIHTFRGIYTGIYGDFIGVTVTDCECSDANSSDDY